MKTAQFTPGEWFDFGLRDRFEHNGHTIFYVDDTADAQKTALLLVHGFPTSSYDWVYMWPKLKKKYRLIAPDMIGFGYSDKPVQYDYSIMDQADLHEALLKQLGVSEMHVLAHDYGDTVAQELLARYEERLAARARGGPDTFPRYKSITFLNGGLFPETHRARLIQKLLISPLGSLITKVMGEKTFRKKFSEVFGPHTKPSDRELKDFWQIIQYQKGTRIYHKLIRYMADRRRHRERWVACLQNTKIPIRLINGPADPVSGLHMTERYRELIANPDIVLLDGIGHYPQTEDPAGVLRAFLEFVQSHD
ncbi:MAG: alpha/beta hydrolase [Leptospirales bacterium]|jgi:pimeloyl-ACP methyl ester carboxylesterase